jgi:glycosyltransferase involved in cell wall biosynthesis
LARILFASFDEIPSFKGSSTHILSTFRTLCNTHEITLISLGTNPLPESVGFRHLCFAIQEKNYLKRGLLFQERISQHLLTNRYDLAHFRSFWEGGAIQQAGFPSVFELNALASLELKESYRSASNEILNKIRLQEQHCAQNAHFIFSPSIRTSQYATQQLQMKSGSISVIPNGFDWIEPIKKKKITNTIKIAYVGTLHPWQGLLWSLKCIQNLPIELHIFAPSHRVWNRLLLKRISKLNLQSQVIIHEPLPKIWMQKKIAELDLGFSPLLKVPRNTEQGCFPIKNLDYLSSGIPVLASDLFVNRQLLNEKSNAIFFAPNSRLSLRNTLEQICANPKQIISLSASFDPSLKDLPSWHDYSQKIGSIYEQLLMGERNRPLTL